MRANLTFAAVLLVCLAACANASSSQTIQANVGVICPFSLSLSSGQPSYAWGTSLDFTYTIYNQANCNAPGMSGILYIEYASNDVIAYSTSLSVNSLSQTP